MSSIQELWTPAPELAWLLKHPHAPNTRKHPLLCYTVPRAMPSLLVLFRGCKEEIQPSSSVCEAPSHTRFVKQAQTPFPHPEIAQRQTNSVHTATIVLDWRGKHHRDPNRVWQLGRNKSDWATWIPESFMALTWPKRIQKHPKFMALFSHSLGNTKQQNFPQWACGNDTKMPCRDPSN